MSEQIVKNEKILNIVHLYKEMDVNSTVDEVEIMYVQ
jgi:hypothetical protein